MIKLLNITKKYGNNVILNDVSLEIKDGEFIGIIGESGSGKTTLLQVMSGIIPNDGGDVFYDDVNICKLKEEELFEWRKNNVGFVFQINNLVDELTVQDNLEIAMLIKGEERVAFKSKIFEALKEVNLVGFETKKVSNLSGGEKQRVAIAMAIVRKPKILFADEPTGSLDSKNGQNIMELFKEINKKYKTTIIMVTHSLNQLKYCSRSISIKDGLILQNEKGK